MFPSKELDKATDHYNENRTLGQGGQGTVYKGMLADGKIIAVKKSKVIDEGNLRQFINEVVLLSQINHRNVVKLLGCCLETELPLLVYEFIPNGTLFQFLHDPNEEFPLTWEIRVRIATEVVKQGKKEELLMVASLARSCLRLNGKERPTMKEVTMVLERIQKSENLIVQREIEYEKKEVMGAPWDATSNSTISSFGISASSSLDEKPLLHTY
ncbi:hypothetical protein OIU77_005508 [Salix suchowensis]|uniref:Protein kinase domain-containing protein n=1 Tax=Salix suchowensis TaxID=1278906 RepID=A0ABQ9APN0_9ROSI|nr:hypothetical protein OIU77_005508 [Salix suchowensis]